MQKTTEQNLFFTRMAVSTTFFTVGAIFSNWASRIPEVKTSLGLTDATLGLALMFSSIGVIFGLLITSGLIARFGSKNVSFYTAVIYAIVLGTIGFAFNFVTLSIALFFAGMCNSITDVAMNTQGAEVELRLNKQIMNSFHAFWSIGLGSGFLMGFLFVSMDFSYQQHFLIVPIFFIILMLLARPHLLDLEDEKNTEDQATFQLPPRAIWGLGALAFAAGLSEGAIIDWGSLYIQEVVGETEAVAALGLAIFSGMMVIMRFAGDKVAEWIGAVFLVRLGSIAVVIGLGAALLFPNLWATVAGFSLAGIGLAVAIPLAFSAAGKLPNISSGRAIAGVATIGYAAFLIGPPVIGFIAEGTSLRLAFVVVMVLAATMLVTGSTLNVEKAKTGA